MAALLSPLAGLLGLAPDSWTAIAAWIALAGAAGAVWFARQQAVEARGARRQADEHARATRDQSLELARLQAQPNVIVFIEPDAVFKYAVELVVRNVGDTPAHDVRVHIDPKPASTFGQPRGRLLKIPETFPVLVPGQEWRTLWASMREHDHKGMATSYRAVVTFNDSATGTAHRYEFVLDWEAQMMRSVSIEYTAHDAAKALREIAAKVHTWTEFGGGLSVIARDGDAHDDRRRRDLDHQELWWGDQGGEVEGSRLSTSSQMRHRIRRVAEKIRTANRLRKRSGGG